MAFATIQETVSQTSFLLPKEKKSQYKGDYYRTYYQNNRQKLLTYSHDYYQFKKLLEPYLKKREKTTDRHRLGYYQEYEKKPKRKEYKKQWIAAKRAEKNTDKKLKSVVDNFLSHTHIKEHSLREKERFFFVDNTRDKKKDLVRRLDQKYLRLPTKNKIPQKKGWNQPWFEEWLDKSGLLKKYQEWSLRGGKQIGNKFLSFLDLDINKTDLEPWRIKQLEKNVRLLLDYLGCFYVETKKGFHVYLLTEELLPNEMIYHVDSWLKKEQIIGSIQSKGKYVVGFDSVDKKLVEKGKWFWHIKDLAQIKTTLARFFLVVGRQEKIVDDYLVKMHQDISVKKQNVDNTFKFEKTGLEQVLRLEKRLEQPRKISVKVKIVGKKKTCLAELWKVFYLDQKTQQNGYFLVNDYQKSYLLPNLDVGSVRGILLVNGYKHRFLSRMC